MNYMIPCNAAGGGEGRGVVHSSTILKDGITSGYVGVEVHCLAGKRLIRTTYDIYYTSINIVMVLFYCRSNLV